MIDIVIISRTLYEPDDIVELRCFRGRGRGSHVYKRWLYAKDLPGEYKQLKDHNDHGYNIYFGVNPRKYFNKSKDVNVLMARCLFCDFDDVDPGDGCGRLEYIWREIFVAGLPEPTLAIHSGHGLHTYWRLGEPMHDLDEWRLMQEKLNTRLGADQSIKNPERIMRMPGFMNTKEEPWQECFICWKPSYASH